MAFFKESKGPAIFNCHGIIPKQCPECGGGLVRVKISNMQRDLICALCGIKVGSLMKTKDQKEENENLGRLRNGNH